jgi:hypothetical protein
MRAKPMDRSRRTVALLALFLLMISAAFASSLISATSAFAAPVSIAQCDGTDNVGGQNVECTVSIVNNLDQATGLASSTVTLEECHGAANAEPTCVTTVTTNATDLVLTVDQCNGSGNGGGGTVNCIVDVTNNVVGSATVAPVSINQCNESGQGGGTEPTVACDPIGVTTDATVTQCNTSGQGGGDSERVRCTVDTASTETSAIPVKITQCIESGNGGGGTVICSTSLRSIVTAAVPGDGETPGEGETPIPGDGGTPTPGEGETPGSGGDIPVTPGSPEAPVVPEAPTPENPAVPVVPENETPIIPDAPVEGPGATQNEGPQDASDRAETDRSNSNANQNLAYTGSEVAPLALGAAGLMLLGVALIALKRRSATRS